MALYRHFFVFVIKRALCFLLKYKFEIRQIGADGFYFVFRFSGNSAFISNFFESVDEAISVIKSLQETALEDRNYTKKQLQMEMCFSYLA